MLIAQRSVAKSNMKNMLYNTGKSDLNAFLLNFVNCRKKMHTRKCNMIKKRKATHFIINSLILIVLALIIINQTAWLVNMYRLHAREFSALSNSAAQEAGLKELAERTEEIGGHRVFSTNMNMSNPDDTARYITLCPA